MKERLRMEEGLGMKVRLFNGRKTGIGRKIRNGRKTGSRRKTGKEMIDCVGAKGKIENWNEEKCNLEMRKRSKTFPGKGEGRKKDCFLGKKKELEPEGMLRR